MAKCLSASEYESVGVGIWQIFLLANDVKVAFTVLIEQPKSSVTPGFDKIVHFYLKINY